MIIIGVDFSPGSATAASVALDLAERLGSPWKLVYVSATPAIETTPEEAQDAWLERLALDRADLECKRGVPWIELVRTTGEASVSLVAVGTHGRSGFQPLRLGRTAEAISLRSSAPVLLVSPTHAAVSAAAYRGTSTIPKEGS